MQGYTEMGDTSTTTVRQALINHEGNINSIRSGNSGASFPPEAVAGMRCYRTDEGKEYIYDGKTWNELAKASDTSEKINNEIAPKLDKLSEQITKSETTASTTYATKKEAGVPYQIQRNAVYSEGDILTSPDLPPGYILVVTTSGTTGSEEPDWDTIRKNTGGVDGGVVFYIHGSTQIARNANYMAGDILICNKLKTGEYIVVTQEGTTGTDEPDFSAMEVGQEYTDGTTKYCIEDTLSKHNVGDIVFKPLDKVGVHEYLLPLDGQEIDGTKYKRLADYLGTTTLPDLNGRYMRADKTPNQMVEAGLPNITGTISAIQQNLGCCFGEGTGVFLKSDNIWKSTQALQADWNNTHQNTRDSIKFDASDGSPIYGNSDTVTPLTYTVRAYIAYA